MNPADLAPRSHAYLLHRIIYPVGFNATSVIGLLCQRDVAGFSCYSVCLELSVTSSIVTKPSIEGIQKKKEERDFLGTSVTAHVSVSLSCVPWCEVHSEPLSVFVHPQVLMAPEKEGSRGSLQVYKVTLRPGAASLHCLSG